MNKNLYLLIVITSVCVSFASISHVMLVREQLDEISLAKEKRMKLNGFFRGRLASYYSLHLEDMRDDIRDGMWRRGIKETEEEMKRDGYTTYEIKRIVDDSEIYGRISFDLSDEEVYRKALKKVGWSDEDIEQKFNRMSELYSHSAEPFALD